MVEINLPIIIGAAVVDSINPCAFGVLIFLLAYLAETVKKRIWMLINGLIYIFAVFVTYLAAGLILLPILKEMRSFSLWGYAVLGTVVIIAGLLEIKDFFFYGKWISLSIMPTEVERIKHYVSKVSDKPLTAFFLGVFVALVELPCTGAVYLAVLALMSLSGVTIGHIWFLVLYNLIFVLPLIIILFAVYKGTSTEKFEHWRQKHKRAMRLITGLTLIILGLWMIFTVV
ncbi:MAG: GAP family protein [Candidatus Woesearchaeota archaeon]